MVGLIFFFAVMPYRGRVPSTPFNYTPPKHELVGRRAGSRAFAQETVGLPTLLRYHLLRHHSFVKATKGRRMATDLSVGARAPEFTLPRDGGGTISLKEFRNRKLVLYFYPKADTPGCTKESIAFSKLRGAFAKANTDILGVSADSVKAQDAFKAKHDLSIPLASDEKRQMLEAYGVWGEKSMYGRTYMGIMRTTFLIGPDGRIGRVWNNVKVNGHAEEVLDAARTL
jgi:peroxiredoxin Q/BCP